MAITAGSDAAVTDFEFIIGCVLPWAGRSAPGPSSKWIICDGSAVSRTTYADLFAVISPSLGTFTVTIASPGVFTLNSHGLQAGDAVYLTTTGALPTGLAQNTIYYVISTGLTANSFQLSTSRGGSAINTSGSQSGTHTLRYCPYGLGDGSTTFNVPDLRQRAPFGYKASDTKVGYVGQTGGAQTHTLTTAEIPAHTHDHYGTSLTAGAGIDWASNGANHLTQNQASGSTGGGGAHENMPPYITMNYIIRGAY